MCRRSVSALAPASTCPSMFLLDFRALKECCLRKAKLGAVDAYRRRCEYQRLTLLERKNFLYSNFSHVFDAAKQTIDLRVDGWLLCNECYVRLLAVGRSTFFNRLKEWKAGTRVSTRVRDKRGPSARGMMIRLRMREFFLQAACQSPESKQRYLPPGVTKVEVFQEIASELGFDPLMPPFSLSFFRSIWKKEFGDVVVTKSPRLGKCTDCEQLRVALDAAKDPIEKSQVVKQRSEHIAQVRKDRLVYHKRKLEARSNPEWLVLIHDGMVPPPPIEEHGLKVRVIGTLAFSQQQEAHAHLVTPRFAGATNCNLEAQRRVLQSFSTRPFLPRYLHLQLDNTSKENKNNILIAFLLLLVANSLFDAVEVMFLRVGHTHEDVDQMFSCFSRALKKQPAYSLPSLISSMKRSYSPEPEISQIECVIDFQRFAESAAMLDEWTVREWHGLRLSRDQQGRVLGEYKKWMADEEWRRNPLDHVLYDPALVKRSVFHYVIPYPLRLKQFRSMVQSHEKQLNTSRSGQLPPYCWWERFLLREERDQASWCPRCNEIRVEQAGVSIREKDPPELKKAKQTKSKLLAEALKEHINGGTCSHEAKIAHSELLEQTYPRRPTGPHSHRRPR